MPIVVASYDGSSFSQVSAYSPLVKAYQNLHQGPNLKANATVQQGKDCIINMLKAMNMWHSGYRPVWVMLGLVLGDDLPEGAPEQVPVRAVPFLSPSPPATPCSWLHLIYFFT